MGVGVGSCYRTGSRLRLRMLIHHPNPNSYSSEIVLCHSGSVSVSDTFAKYSKLISIYPLFRMIVQLCNIHSDSLTHLINDVPINNNIIRVGSGHGPMVRQLFV